MPIGMIPTIYMLIVNKLREITSISSGSRLCSTLRSYWYPVVSSFYSRHLVVSWDIKLCTIKILWCMPMKSKSPHWSCSLLHSHSGFLFSPLFILTPYPHCRHNTLNGYRLFIVYIIICSSHRISSESTIEWLTYRKAYLIADTFFQEFSF